MYFIFTSITFPSSHLFSELCELCGWQFPPRTPLRGISWGWQCPAANQKVAPSPWDQLQQLQRPRRQVVCLPNTETLRYLARAAGKLLVCCLHPNQGHTGHLPALPMSKSDCLGTLKQGVKTASKGSGLRLDTLTWCGDHPQQCDSGHMLYLPALELCFSGHIYIVCCHLRSAHRVNNHSQVAPIRSTQPIKACPSLEPDSSTRM